MAKGGIGRAVQLIFSAFSFRFKDSRRKGKDLKFRRQALYNESFMTASLRDQLESLLQDIANSGTGAEGADAREIDSVIITVDKKAIGYVMEVANKIDCDIISCAQPGVFILQRRVEFL